MAPRLQFGLRWLLLLTFLVAAWAALAFNYESFLGAGWRTKAFMLTSSVLTAAVILTAASVTPHVARFHRLIWQSLSVTDYEFISHRLGRWLSYLGCFQLPLGVIAYFDTLLAEQLYGMPRGLIVSILMAFGALLWILLAMAISMAVLWVKAARWRCPACDRRFSRINLWHWSSWSRECANCHFPLKGGNQTG